MKIDNGSLDLDGNLTGFSPNGNLVSCTIDGTKVLIPLHIIVRLYEGSKWHHEKNSNISWEDFLDDLFNK